MSQEMYDKNGNYVYTGNATITTGNDTLRGGAGLGYSQFGSMVARDAVRLLQEKIMSGNKPIVVCAGCVQEADDMDKAQALAESLAHSKGADAYILKPVKKVAPKRDVVTTDL